MSEQNPLKSLYISPTLLHSSAQSKPRPPTNKSFSLIISKPHPSYPLSIHNYNPKAAFSRATWDALSLAARSLVTHSSTGAVISRSMSKFFNFHEKWAYKPTGTEYAWRIEEKLDGSLISLFYYSYSEPNRKARGEWMFVSRSAFEVNSPHASSARRILERRYPGVLDGLDRELTYVFELVDPKLPIKVKYAQEDLYILSVVGKDGKEPPYDFDWTRLPFPRPRTHGHGRDLMDISNSKSTGVPDLKELSKLNLRNEEGFVVLFWATKDDRYPQRVKVKFESYLDDTHFRPQVDGLHSAMSKISALASLGPSSSNLPKLPHHLSTPTPPSPALILELYTHHRSKIAHFKPTTISTTMERHKQSFLQSLAPLADDYGGAAWLELVERTWDRIHALVSLQEADLVQKMSELQREGYKPGAAHVKSHLAKGGFERRVRKSDVDPGFREALRAWFGGEPGGKQVAAFLSGLEIPRDLRSQDVLKAL
ncbi:hypothetical protein CVT26_007430 [Gymnopilus dilepis]|uniref:T4 RNA ligase 1-like N-terminal domain-containing protein n=1 Tax=Gymnopilus dilepis TaxID=231916 RepID=A0A409WQ26_9AGAR|nr:hypothetical protein CVT26_007430 [Gymnopilus dilepis]